MISRIVHILIGGSAVLVAACAVGVNETGDLEDGTGGGVITGTGGFGGSNTTSPTTTVGSGGMPGSSVGGGGMGGMGGDPGNCDFSHIETCETAESLGNIAGDENDPAINRFGTSSRWYEVRIREENGSVFEEDLSYTVTLTSAAGMDYDLIVHQGGQDDPPNCNATPKLGVDQGGGVETVSDSWDDDQGIGGEDDHVYLNIEVRHVSGTACDSSAEFTLTVEGHT